MDDWLIPVLVVSALLALILAALIVCLVVRKRRDPQINTEIYGDLPLAPAPLNPSTSTQYDNLPDVSQRTVTTIYNTREMLSSSSRSATEYGRGEFVDANSVREVLQYDTIPRSQAPHDSYDVGRI